MVPNRAKHHIISGMVHTLQLTSLKQFFAHLWTWIKIQKSKNLVLEVTKGNSGEYSGLRKNTLREKIPKYRVFFWSFFSRIQSKCVKIRTRKNSVFGHSSRSDNYYTDTWQKQPSTGALEKRSSENMQQTCRRTPTTKCDFNKVAKQLYWNRTFAWVFSCKFAAYFQNIFS